MQSTALTNSEGIVKVEEKALLNEIEATVAVVEVVAVPSTLEKYRAIWGDEKFYNRRGWKTFADIEKSGVMKWLEKIEVEANKQGLDDEGKKWMTRVMYCESGGYEGARNPKAIPFFISKDGVKSGYGHPSGLYQIHPLLWIRDKDNMNKAKDIFDGNAQVEYVAYKYKLGGKGIWECK